MLATAHAQALLGLDGVPVEVEAHVARGVPSFQIVGLPDRAVMEARERVRSGIVAAELEFPLRRVTVSLAPGALRKLGARFDLAIAIALLAATGQVPSERAARILCLGELALDARVRPVPGALLAAETARTCGLESILCARASAGEAALLEGVSAIGVEHLAEAAAWLRGERSIEPASPPVAPRAEREVGGDLADVRGQPLGRRALELAAAGGHALLLVGPPGAGKTMLARRLPGLLPDLVDGEALEVTRIHSAVGGCRARGRARAAAAVPRTAPRRVLRSTGGRWPRPLAGRATRAHRGVLFLDELGEFSRVALEALRQPLEDGELVVVRASGRARFPAAAQLVAAMNPCPCGGARECTCSREQLDRYRARLSGPLLDRIDLVVRIAAPDPSDMRRDRPERSASVRARVVVARSMQLRRGQSGPNARQPLAALETAGIAPDASDLLERAAARIGLSGRAQVRALRVARTVADLAEREQIAHDDLAEALAFHPRGGVLG